MASRSPAPRVVLELFQSVVCKGFKVIVWLATIPTTPRVGSKVLNSSTPRVPPLAPIASWIWEWRASTLSVVGGCPPPPPQGLGIEGSPPISEGAMIPSYLRVKSSMPGHGVMSAWPSPVLMTFKNVGRYTPVVSWWCIV